MYLFLHNIKLCCHRILCAAFVLISVLSITTYPANADTFDEIFSDSADYIPQDKNSAKYHTLYEAGGSIFRSSLSRRLPKGKNKLVARVDLSEQRMKVFVNGSLWREWRVSSGAKGYTTPTGSWKPKRMHEMWHSRKYDMTPMPHSVFYNGGFAIHATDYIKYLGRPASHGCVRLHPEHAKTFFKMVKDFGMHKTRIVITQ